LAAPLTKRALKRAALDLLDQDQEPRLFLSEPATTSVIEEPAAQRQSASQAKLPTFYNEDGRFVLRCASGAYLWGCIRMGPSGAGGSDLHPLGAPGCGLTCSASSGRHETVQDCKTLRGEGLVQLDDIEIG
jgi:hypothetical protein